MGWTGAAVPAPQVALGVVPVPVEALYRIVPATQRVPEPIGILELVVVAGEEIRRVGEKGLVARIPPVEEVALGEAGEAGPRGIHVELVTDEELERGPEVPVLPSRRGPVHQ